MPAQAQLCHLSVDDLLETSCQDVVFSKRLLQLFLNITPSTVQTLERALGDGDRATWRHASHTLKGNALLIGARRLSRMAADLERDGCQGLHATEAVAALREEYAQVSREAAICAADSADLFKQAGAQR